MPRHSGPHKLHEGDIVNIDVTVLYDKYHGDSSRMYVVGKTSPRNMQLIKCAQEGMYEAIKTVRQAQTLPTSALPFRKLLTRPDSQL